MLSERRKVNVLEVKYLGSLVGVSQFTMDRVRNEEMHRRAGVERELSSGVDFEVYRWFAHIERINE